MTELYIGFDYLFLKTLFFIIKRWIKMDKIILEITKDCHEEILDEGFVFSIDLNKNSFLNSNSILIKKENRKIKYGRLYAKKYFLLNKNKK